ncbi:MAG: CCA tRNA nucleotidyltransferase [Lactobacillaceae bacterium]|jgi:tRNA nucleotidyltransferase/poly(A) polymerase|nr:CCA tRNA nucleotidyltransferase [Lactobacillaceae bacterium]
MIRDKYLDINKIIKDPEIFKLFRAVDNYGGILRFVGGCVRDAIVGIEGFDLDLATDLTPDELVEACQENDIKTVPIGIKYGTVGAVVNGQVLEITSLRKDIKTDGRHAIVEFTDDWSVDASRRDLTINAVYADENGNVFDYYNGISDLENGIVRFIGKPKNRIKEDYLRILRFFRFYSKFGKTEIDADALKACVENKDGLKNISMERVRDELQKILVTPNAVKTFKIMYENGIITDYMPYPKDLEALTFLTSWFDDTKYPNSEIRRMFIILNPDKKAAEKVSNMLKYSNKKKDYLIKLAAAKIAVEDLLNEDNITKFVYLYGKEFLIDKLITSLALEKFKVIDIEKRIENIKDAVVPIFPIRGKDLLALGAKDKKIGELLDLLQDLWVRSSFTINRDELLEEAKIIIKSM